jgi:tRNA(fMet)-specific endonuclease VapC
MYGAGNCERAVFVLDTNTIIHFFKGRGRVAGSLAAVPPSEIAVPSIVIYELELGVRGSANPTRRREELDAFLDCVEEIPFDRSVASVAADIRTRLERAGLGIGPFDTLIAATALARGATLVTHNRREFARVPGLAVVDWF